MLSRVEKRIPKYLAARETEIDKSQINPAWKLETVSGLWQTFETLNNHNDDIGRALYWLKNCLSYDTRIIICKYRAFTRLVTGHLGKTQGVRNSNIIIIRLPLKHFTISKAETKTLGQKPWSSGYGRRLTFKRSWVRIPVPDTGWTFFTYIVVKL